MAILTIAAVVGLSSAGGATLAGFLVSASDRLSVSTSAGSPGGTATLPPAPTPVPAASLPVPDTTATPVAEPEPVAPEPEPAPAPPPVSPAETPCDTGVTMSVWAHYDDDLLFMNPRLLEAFDAGRCVRTVFLTGSDAGRGEHYAKGRELGILRAYNTMRGAQGFWAEHRVTLNSGVEISQWSPEDDPDITVVFLRLPDGAMNGAGFRATGFVTLPALVSGALTSLAPIDGGTPLTLDALTSSLSELIIAYRADQLYTHVPQGTEWAGGDHPDHSATGTVTRAAWQAVGFPADRVSYAVGYRTKDLPVNLSGDLLARKIDAFRVYAAQDSVVSCASAQACLDKPKFGAWLQRQYAKTDGELFPAG
ncbi:PIG-L family deacetylase [Microbacterium chocolatum]|uniref:PIG-L deacetylase family protein n=1 Tax=Microbacterium aurantiacum TaxID=162393 RepID=UPI00338E86DD